MNGNEESYKSIEAAVAQMEHIEEMTAEELRDTLADAERFAACRDLMEAARVLREESGCGSPDVEKEWRAFGSRRLAVRRWIAGGVAAAVAVAVALWRFGALPEGDPVTVFVADEAEQRVVLHTSSGLQVALEEADAAALAGAGAALRNEEALEYRAAGNAETHTLSTPRGKDFKVWLSDGTEVWLNAESRLEYPAAFVGDRREVRLTGEAYFKVAPDAQRPFVIRTDFLQTRVLGTELNVCSYSASDSHVTLMNGSVEVAAAQGTDFLRLAPGEDAALLADGSFVVREVDLSAYIYWKEGFFFYDDMPLEDILLHLGRWYNVSVTFQNRDAMKYRMRFSSRRESGLDFAVLLLNRMEKVSIRLDENGLIVK
jgi:ferric-dicitrate binding protein FerR (iron transport regulator)